MKWEEGVDEDFTFIIGEEVTYSEDNKDYTILKRINIRNLGKFYLARACDPSNPVQQLNINVNDEGKLTKITPIDALQKLWPSLTYEGDFHKTENYIRNVILRQIVDLHSNVSHKVKFYAEGDSFKMDFDDTIFTIDKQ